MGQSLLEKELLSIIESEGNTPLTDQEIASKLKIRRELVNSLRNKLDIPKASQRLEKALEKDIKNILIQYPDISIREIEKKLYDKNYSVSTSLVYKTVKSFKKCDDHIKDASEKELNTVKASRDKKNDDEGFSKVIGYDGSLKNQIICAKAAVQYPPRGLHTILSGKTGVGKSYLAKSMYEYAVSKNIMPPNKFVLFNCADYANNAQLLCSHLFGHVKGAFTGADKDKRGVMDLADGGMLFLDEVHRLPSEGQEMLFNIIDNGTYKRLGESERTQHVNTMIVAATTEDLKSSLLDTFRRRIPMVIEIPDLMVRSKKEKLQFIRLFIGKESVRIKRNIEITHEACSAFILYNPLHNIGQLESDIKVTVAKAYLKYVSLGLSSVKITLDILPEYIVREWINNGNVIGENCEIPEKIVISGDEYSSDDEEDSGDIYKYIDDIRKEFNIEGITSDEASKKLTKVVEKKIEEIFNKNSFEWNENTKYYSGINRELLYIIEDFLNEISYMIPKVGYTYKNLKYALGFHLETMVSQIKSGLEIIHPDLEKVRDEDEAIYLLSVKLIRNVEKRLSISIPDDEIGYVSLYLGAAVKQKFNDKNKIAIIVACHGEVASKMLEVANYFIEGGTTTAINMSLNISPIEIYNQIKKEVLRLYKYEGILLLTDMGSLTHFGEDLTNETGIRVETVSRVDTLMVMEAIYLTKFNDNSLDDIKDKLNNKSQQVFEVRRSKKSCIVIYCVTGEGNARQIGNYLCENFLGIETQYEILYYGMIDVNINELIKELSKTHDIKLVIGTILSSDIDINIPYLNADEIVCGQSLEDLKKIIRLPFKANLKRLLMNSIVMLNPEETSREGIINRLCGELERFGAVNKGFAKDIKDREKLVTTYVGSGLAIPHTISFDNINYSQIAIAVYNDPIRWCDFPVNIVCMLAIKANGGAFFEQIYKRITNNFDLIKNAESQAEISEIILKSI